MKRTTADLQLVKQTLHDFVLNRQGASAQQLESDFGDLLLYLMRLADRVDVDLFRAADGQLEQRAARSPKLVPK